MKIRFAIMLLAATLLASAALAGAAPAAEPDARAAAAAAQEARSDLSWLMCGLQMLIGTRDAGLRLKTPQAKGILARLEPLAREGVIFTGPLPENGQDGRPGLIVRTGSGPGSGSSRPSQADRAKMLDRLRRQTEMIQSAIDGVLDTLTTRQNDAVMKVDFKPEYYGLGRQRGDPATMSQAEREKERRGRMEGIKRLAALDQAVMSGLRKLAGK